MNQSAELSYKRSILVYSSGNRLQYNRSYVQSNKKRTFISFMLYVWIYNHLLETELLCFSVIPFFHCLVCFFFLLFPAAWYRHCQLINIKLKTVNILSTTDFIKDYACVCCLYLFLQQNTAYHTTSPRNKI